MASRFRYEVQLQSYLSIHEIARGSPATTRSLYRSEFALLQFIHGAGTAALGWCLPASTVFGPRFSLVSMVSINLGIWFYGVGINDAGESIEPEESQ